MKDSQAEKTHQWQHPELSSLVARHIHRVWLFGFREPKPAPAHFPCLFDWVDCTWQLKSLPRVPSSMKLVLTLHNARKKGCPVLSVGRDQRRCPESSVLS